MLKKYSEVFRSLLVLCDLVLTAAAFGAAVWLRFEAPWFRRDVVEPLAERVPALAPVVLDEAALTAAAPTLIEVYTSALVLVLPVCLLVSIAAGLYRPRRAGSFGAEVRDVFKVTFGALVVLLAAAFFFRGWSFSRVTVVLFALLHPGFLIVSRALVRTLLRQARRRGYNLRRALILGSGRVGQQLALRIGRNKWTGIRVRGYLDWRPARVGRSFCKVPVIGVFAELAEVIAREGIDQVFVCLPYAEQHRMREVLPPLVDATVDVRIVPDYLSLAPYAGDTSEFDGLPIVSLLESPLYGWNRLLKRGFDVAFALAVLMVMALPLAIIAALVKLGSPGPVFYAQERMGLDGRTFTLYKFRTMHADAERETGAVWAAAQDPRRTALGRFLRASSLDEFPQFWNVLKGEMSVVGPRPERPVFIAEFRRHVPRYMLRHKTKAGITGWAQVNGWRGNTSLRKRIQYDLFYIRHWSFLFDLKIIVLTFSAGLVHRNAY